MARYSLNTPSLPLPSPSPTSIASPTFKKPWKTAIPAERHTRQESDLSFPSERDHYRRPTLSDLNNLNRLLRRAIPNVWL